MTSPHPHPGPPPGLHVGDEIGTAPPKRRFTPRTVAEALAVLLIAAGFFMMMQPFALVLYTWSFAVMLAGTALFIVGSKFPG